MLCWSDGRRRAFRHGLRKFGEGYVRFSVANSLANLAEALHRIDQWPENL